MKINHSIIMQGLVALMFLLLTYVGFNYEDIIEGGIAFMLPMSFVFALLLILGLGVGAKVFFQQEANNTETKNEINKPIQLKPLSIVKSESKENPKEDMVEMSLEDYSTLKNIFEKHNIKK